MKTYEREARDPERLEALGYSLDKVLDMDNDTRTRVGWFVTEDFRRLLSLVYRNDYTAGYREARERVQRPPRAA